MGTLFRFSQIKGVLITLIVVFLMTRLGGAFTLEPDGVSLFWPPNAVLLSAMLILDRKHALLCLVLCFPMYTAAELWSGYPIQNAVLFSLANCAETGVAFFIVTSFLKTPYAFVSFYNFLVFLFAIVIGSVLGGFIGAHSIYLLGGDYPSALTGWILGDFIAFLVLTPLLLTLREWPVWLSDASRLRKIEAAAIVGIMLLLLAIAIDTFGLAKLRFVGIQVVPVGLVYVATVRLGVKGGSISTLLFALVIFALQLHDFGAFVDLPQRSGVVGMQVYIAAVVFSSVSLALLIAERDASLAELEKSNLNLEALVTQRSKELLRRTGQLAKAQKMEAIGKVTGGVAHDFNNLLTIIQGNTELVEHNANSGKIGDEIASIKAAVASGSNMTYRLLAYSRKTVLSPKPTNIAQLITDELNIFQRLVGETVIITHHIDRAVWHAMVDSNRFEGTLLNLVINARDALMNGGELLLTLENVVIDKNDSELLYDLDAGSFVLLTVTDTGTGIQPEILSRVIDPFFTTKKFGQGSGLGLSMAYGFAKQSGGHLAINSTEGESTTVRLYLPRAPGEEHKSNDLEMDEKPIERKTCRVLVVEDNPEVLRVFRQILEVHGYVVASAVNGAEALAILENEGLFDLLITDIILPGEMSGFDIQREAHLLQPGIGSILTTGYTNLTNIDDVALKGSSGILYKPFTSNDLLKRIDLIQNKAMS